jgi:hypothetical protein
MAREDEDRRPVSQDACQRCGTTEGLIPDRDVADLYLCTGCTQEIARQQQFIDWGFGEAPDDLG